MLSFGDLYWGSPIFVKPPVVETPGDGLGFQSVGFRM